MKVRISRSHVILLCLLILMVRKFAGIISLFSVSVRFQHLTLLIPTILLLTCIFWKPVRIWNLILIPVGMISYWKSKDDTLIILILLILAWGQRDANVLIRFWFEIQATVLIACTGLYMFLLALGSPLAKTGLMDGRLRYYFMFNHPNNYSIQMFFCLMAFVYLYGRKVKKAWLCLIFIIFAVFFALLPKTYTATISMLCIGGLLLCTWYLRKHLKLIYGCFTVAIFVITYGCVALIYSGKGDFVSRVFSGSFYGRMNSAATLLHEHPLTLFGRQMTELGRITRINGDWNVEWADMAYTRCFMAFGIIGGAVLIFLLFRSFYGMVEKQCYGEALALAAVCIYGVSEWSAFSITTAWGMIFLGEGLARHGAYIESRK